MNDWFIWNGVDCRDYGIHALSQPSPIRPSERVQSVNIPGRSGALTIKEGKNVFDPYNFSVNCVIDDPYSRDPLGYSTFQQIIDISRWLRGKGTVTFANRTGGFFKANIANQMTFDKVLRDNPHRQFSVQFDCDPFFYFLEGGIERELQFSEFGTTSVTNVGNVPSDPKFRILKDEDSESTTGTLMVGGSSITITFPEDITEIVFDCESMLCYSNNPLTLRGGNVVGDWFQIDTNPDGVFITKTGNIGSVYLTPNWRCV